MKIAYVIDYFQPSLGYQETYLAKESIALGHEVKVITSDRYFPFPHYDESYSAILGKRVLGVRRGMECGINVVRLPIKRELHARVWMIGLERELLSYKPDYILVHNVATVSAYRVARIRFPGDVKIVYDDHMSGIAPEHLRHKLMRWFFTSFMRRRIIQSASMVACVTKAGVYHLEKVLRIPRSKLRYIPLGFDPSVFFHDQVVRNKVRLELEVRSTEILGIYSGKINESKGISELIKSLSSLFEANDNFKFIFVGGGERRLIDRITRTLPAKRCMLMDFVSPSRLGQLYNAADFGVWPNGITASHIEANACGLPIIVSSWNVSRERVTQGNGVALQSCTPDQISESVSLMLNNDERRRQMQRVALKISEQLTWKSINEQFLNV